jgi:copper homeostasis protein
MEKLIDLGVDRILTSGTQWGDGLGAVDGVDELNKLIKQADERLEVVVGGGVSLATAPVILSGLQQKDFVSLHAYSGIRKNGVTDVTLVNALVDAAKRK